jgi:hypothetical protein
MSVKARKTGVHGAGGAAWRTHGCLFYETQPDLLDILIPFFKVGLEHGEPCLWIVYPPLTADEAQQALRQSIPEFDRFLSEQRIELISYAGWSMRRVMGHLNGKLAEALGRGQAGRLGMQERARLVAGTTILVRVPIAGREPISPAPAPGKK